VPGVQLDVRGGVRREGGEQRVVAHALDVAVVLAVEQQPEAVAGVLGFAIAVQVPEVLALLAFDQVDHVLRVQLLERQVLFDERFVQKLRVPEQLFGLLAEAKTEADAFGSARDADQHMAHVHQRLSRQRAGHDRLVGVAADGQPIERAEQVRMLGRSEAQRLCAAATRSEHAEK
jgi:hypothetical protein